MTTNSDKLVPEARRRPAEQVRAAVNAGAICGRLVLPWRRRPRIVEPTKSPAPGTPPWSHNAPMTCRGRSHIPLTRTLSNEPCGSVT